MLTGLIGFFSRGSIMQSFVRGHDHSSRSSSSRSAGATLQEPIVQRGEDIYGVPTLRHSSSMRRATNRPIRPPSNRSRRGGRLRPIPVSTLARCHSAGDLHARTQRKGGKGDAGCAGGRENEFDNPTMATSEKQDAEEQQASFETEDNFN
jgi:hypothetical protein